MKLKFTFYKKKELICKYELTITSNFKYFKLLLR
jgi:hypothetical protein